MSARFKKESKKDKTLRSIGVALGIKGSTSIDSYKARSSGAFTAKDLEGTGRGGYDEKIRYKIDRLGQRISEEMKHASPYTKRQVGNIIEGQDLEAILAKAQPSKQKPTAKQLKKQQSLLKRKQWVTQIAKEKKEEVEFDATETLETVKGLTPERIQKKQEKFSSVSWLSGLFGGTEPPKPAEIQDQAIMDLLARGIVNPTQDEILNEMYKLQNQSRR